MKPSIRALLLFLTLSLCVCFGQGLTHITTDPTAGTACGGAQIDPQYNTITGHMWACANVGTQVSPVWQWAQIPTNGGGGNISEVPNTQTGTSYTFVNSDCAKMVTFSNASPVAVTLPQAGAGGNFASGCVIEVVNLGAGTVTITPTTSTINGGASMAFNQRQGARIVSDGTNYTAYKAGDSGFWYNGTTITTGQNLDLSGANPTTGFKPPAGAGAAPTTDGVLSFDTTLHHLKVGSNGSAIDLQTSGGAVPFNTSQCAPSFVSGTATIASPCTMQLGTAQYTLGANATVTSVAGTFTVFVYRDSAGTLTAAYQSGTPTCTNITCVTGTSYPFESFPIARFALSSGSFTAVTDDRSAFFYMPSAAGNNITFTFLGGTRTISSTLDTVTGNTLWAQLAAANIFGAGFKQTFSPSATTAGVRILSGAQPSALVSGDFFFNASAILGNYDGTNVNLFPFVPGSGSTAPSAPATGTIPTWGTGFSLPTVANQVTISGIGYAAGGGTAQAQTVTLSPAVAALPVGLVVRWLPAAANSGAAPTLAVNGQAAKPITKLGTAALVANDLTTTAIAHAIYDGTEFQLQNPQTTSGAGANTALSNLASTAINASLVPNASETLNLGSATLPWSTLSFQHFDVYNSGLTKTIALDSENGIDIGQSRHLSIGNTVPGTGTIDLRDGNGLRLARTQPVAWESGTTVVGSMDTGLCRNAASLVQANDGSATCTTAVAKDVLARTYVQDVGSAIASAATIAPTTGMVHITGTTTISTITAPTNFAQTNMGGCIILIPDGLWATNTSGNIALASTAVVSKALTECYDNATSKWYPSY